MTTYLLTGGEGGIGYHISLNLLKDSNNKVILYDYNKNYIPIESSRWPFWHKYRIDSLKKFGDRLVRVRGDVNDRSLLKETLESYKPNVIIHLAAVPIASVCDNYPDEGRKNVFELVFSLLETIRWLNLDIDRLVYASSSMVYGHFLKEGNKILDATEEQLCSPLGIYGAMKLAGEVLLKAYSRKYNIPYTIVRPSAVYGPTQCNKFVAEIFLESAMRGKTIYLENGGHQQADFSYIEDVAHGFVLAANSPNSENETINISRGEGRKIRDLAEIVKKLVPEANIEERKANPFYPNRGALSIIKARKLLDYNPNHSLEEGMKKYYDFLLSNLE